MGVNSLPKTVTGQCRDCDLNPDPSAPESSTLTTRLPSQPSTLNGFVAFAVFSVKLKCSGMSSSDVDVRIQLNVSIFSPVNFTSLDIRRKKTCLRNPALGISVVWLGS